MIGLHAQVGFTEPAFTGFEQVSRSAPRIGVSFDFSDGLVGKVSDATARLDLFESAMAGGELIQLPRGDDWAIHFPGRCRLLPRECPRAILESGPAEFLNPGSSRVRWGASVLMMSNEVSDGGNILQKGLSVSGTQFKLQIDGLQGRPSCAISGDQGRYLAISYIGIADGGWHALECERTRDLLTLYVDGERRADTPIPSTLSIVNNDPLRIGGKGHGPFNDQFHGTIDDVFVEIG